jgi:hypothetical protein
LPGTGSTASEAARQLRRQLRRTVPSSIACAVPGCGEGRVTHDCCYRHSLTGPRTAPDTVPNDGIIDWLAIDIAARGLRRVRLTWVEKDIAVGVILASGGGVQQAQDFTGARVTGSNNGRRLEAALKIAEALNA